MYFPYGNTLEGEFAKGYIEKGKMTYDSGGTFVCTFVVYNPSKGIIKYPNGDEFEGAIDKDGLPYGKVVLNNKGVETKYDYRDLF